MEQYIVSARKYRPATFDSVVGQRALTTTLLNAIRTGKLAHAYLFCGSRGVGKTTCARIFAKTINCLHPNDKGEACNECESCRAFEEQRSMNIHELDAASNNSVEDIRELIEQTRIPPQIGRYKVFIIDEVHMLSNQAFNAFLKTLEEPPQYCIFILATTEKHKILPTILSRCQVYDFARISIQGTVDHLTYVAEKEGYTVEPEALNLIAQKADGGMRDALSIFDQMVSFTGGNITYQSTLENLNVLNSEYYFQLVDYFLKSEIEPCLVLLNEVLSKGFDGGNFIAGLAKHMRDVMVSKDPQTLPLLEVSNTQKVKFQEQAQRCRPQFLYQAIKLCNDCDLGYRTSHNKRLQIEICLIQCTQLNNEDDQSSGRRPTKILKPIFKKQDRKEVKHINNSSVRQTAEAHANKVANNLSGANTASTHLVTQPSVLKASSLGLRLNINAQKVNAVTQPNTTEQVISTHGIMTQNALNLNWQKLINELPVEETALAQRLKSISPKQTNDNTFQITVTNEHIRQDILYKANNIKSYLRICMNLSEINMEILVSEIEAEEKIYNKAEYLKSLMDKYPAIQKLQDTFNLILD